MINVLEMRPTISDIAKLFNISPTTVSFILNGKAIEKRISIALAERVENILQKLDIGPAHLRRACVQVEPKSLG